MYSSGSRYQAPHSVSWQKLLLAVHRCFVGVHASNDSALRVQEFSSFFTGFNLWAATHDANLSPEEAGTDMTTVKRSDVIDGFGRIKIWEAGGREVSITDVTRRLETKHWRPSFAPSQAISVDEMLDTVRDFQRLLCLLQGRPVGFNDLRAEMLVESVTPGKQETRHAEMMVMMTGYKQSFPVSRHVEPSVPLGEMGDKWPSLVSRWLQSIRQFDAPLNLYLAVLFVAELFDEQKLLFIAQALEGYHRCKLKTDVRFLQRLTELTRPHRDTLSIFIRDLPTFLHAVRGIRDELTHPGLGKFNLANQDMHSISQKLKAIFEICMLSDFDAPQSAIVRIARHCREWT